MLCDVCGAKIRGAPKFVRIEGAEMRVCMQCAKLGTEIQRPRMRVDTKAKGPGSAAPAPKRRSRDMFDLMEGEIVDDYADRIREARMARDWSQKDLALKIKEREILIKKIEKGDLIPEDDVRKKLEQVLSIKLVDSSLEDINAGKGGRVTTTFGDLIKIKKGKK
jgi:putative transcription factor